MQCQKCGAELAPFANDCAKCSTPPPIPPDLSRNTGPTSGAAKKDISWLTFALISAPFLLIAFVRTHATYPGDDPKVQGVIAGGAAAAAGIAWLISRIFHTRFRLTWAISYAVVVVSSVAGSLSTMAATATTTTASATAPAESTAQPAEQPVMNVPWPAGWKASPAEHHPGMDGIPETAMLVENGQTVAILVFIKAHDNRRRSLAANAMAMIDGAKEAAVEQGATATFTDPVTTNWAGRAAFYYDTRSTSSEGIRHQRSIATMGANYLVCTLIYTALEANFEKHLGALDTMQKQIDCR